MTWPVSGTYEARVSGSTVVKKAWADALDGVLNSLFSGTATLLGLAFDQTGSTTVTRPGAGALKPYVYIKDAPTDRQLVDQWAISTSGGTGLFYYRRYQTSNGFEETINAAYGSGGTPWSQDAPAWESRRRRINYFGDVSDWQMQTAGHTAWADGAWVDRVIFSADGSAKFGVASSGTFGGGHVRCGRLSIRNGTTYAPGDITPSGFGGTGLVSNVTADDNGGTCLIIAGGGGISSSPSFSLAFKDGAWDNAPRMIAWVTFSDETMPAQMCNCSTTTTTASVQMFHLPVAGNGYRFNWLVLGR